MERFDYIIIGGGIAGTTAAETIRAKDADASVMIIGEEPHRVYSRVMLPHVIRGKTEEEKVFLRSVESYEEKRLVFKAGIAVVGLNSAAHLVRLADGQEIEYAKALLIATGGDVRKLNCPGASEADIIYFQTLDDTRRIMASAARRVLVCGGGFIALELVMSFVHMGAQVTAVLRGDGFFQRLIDARGMSMIADVLRQRGVELITGTEIKAIESSAGIKKVFLTHGREVECDAVAAGIGIVPNAGFLADSGIEVNAGIVTDEFLRTTAPGVYAAGDVAETPDPITGSRRLIGNWQNAIFQGKIAGGNMTGGEDRYSAVTSYSINVFGLPVAFVGFTDSAASEKLVRETMQGSLQLFLNNGCVIGATCVGAFSDRAAVNQLITQKVTISDSMRQAIRTGSTPLANLVP